MGKNDGLWIAGGLAAVLILSGSLDKGKSENPLLNIFPGGFGGDGSLPDLGGIFHGLTYMLDGLTDNLTDATKSMLTAIGDIPTNFNVPPPSPGLTGNGGGAHPSPNPSRLNPSGSFIVDLANAADTLTDAVRSLAITGVGSYAAYKTLPTAINAAKPYIQSTSRAVSNFAARTTQTGLNWASTAINTLSKDVAALPKIPVVMATLASGAAGYAVGSWFNTTSVGKALIEKSGQAGAAFARTSIGQKVYGVAQLNTVKTDSALSKIGMSTTQVQEYLKQGYTPAQIVRGDPLNKPKYPQVFGASTGTYSKDAPQLGRIVGGAR
jgi:hypothetical protein